MSISRPEEFHEIKVWIFFLFLTVLHSIVCQIFATIHEQKCQMEKEAEKEAKKEADNTILA